MKKISIFIQTAFAILFLTSCEDNIDEFTATSTNPVVLSELAIDNVELDGINGANPAVTFTWTPANYGQQTSINYSIEFASDAAFTEPVPSGTINGDTATTLSVSELNTAAASVGLPPFAWNPIYARIVSSIGTQKGLPVASNVITFNVYPYFNYPFKDYYLVGNACAADWNNNNNNPPLFRDASKPKLYNYTGYFAGGQFKVLEVKGLWQPQWGTNDGIAIDVNPGTGSDPGSFPFNNLDITSPGYYSFTMDYSDNTYSFEFIRDTAPANFTSMSIQGTSSTTTAMNQSSFDNHIWYLNSVTLTPGGLQFLTNTGATWSGTTSFSGVAQANAEFLPVVVEDEYDVWFNDLTGQYILIPLNL